MQEQFLNICLIQHLTAFYDVGEHNHIRLRGADWNDGLDMAARAWRKCCIYSSYMAETLKNLAKDIKAYAEKTGNETVLLSKRITYIIKCRQNSIMTE